MWKIKKIILLSTIVLGLLVLLENFTVSNPNIEQTELLSSPRLYVNPEQNIFYTNITNLNDTFVVDIKVNDVSNLYGFDFKLGYNTTLLDVAKVEVFPPWNPYMKIKNETNEIIGRIWLAFSGLIPASPFYGSTTLAKITFKITAKPPVNESVSCNLDLYDSILADNTGNPIVHIVENGYYQYSWSLNEINVESPINRFIHYKSRIDLNVTGGAVDNWFYILNHGLITPFIPNTTIPVTECSNMLEVYGNSSGKIQYQILLFYVYVGDINSDGKIDIKDISTCSRAFGTYPGLPLWNPKCDFNNDGKIDIKDISIVARKFGSTYDSYCSKPKPVMILPKESDNVTGLVLLEATDLRGSKIKDINNVEFQYHDGSKWVIIGRPIDIGTISWRYIWDTNPLPNGNYPVRIYVDSVYGSAYHTIYVHVNKLPLPMSNSYLSGDKTSIIFDGSASYDPDGSIVDQKWIINDTTILYGNIVSYPTPIVPPGYSGILDIPVQHEVKDNYGAINLDHFLNGVVFQQGAPTNVEKKDKDCGCESMDIVYDQDAESYVDQHWMPEGRKREMGGRAIKDKDNNIIRFVYNFNVIAKLKNPSDPKKCNESQRVMRNTTFGVGTANERTEIANGSESVDEGDGFIPTKNIVKCPYYGNIWCDDDYHNETNDRKNPEKNVKFHPNETHIIWMDGPGAYNLTKDDFPVVYQANFEAAVWGKLGWCKCRWDIILNYTDLAHPESNFYIIECSEG